MRNLQQGFSLLEMLLALALFAVMSGVLLNYQRGLQRNSELQWQIRQLWQAAFEYSEGSGQALSEGWYGRSAPVDYGNCRGMSLTIIDKQGRLAQLAGRNCLPATPSQEF